MTPLADALTAFSLTASGPLLALAWAWRRTPLPLPLPEPEPDLDPRVVVHEAGHALTAWHCTAVARVLSVNVLQNSRGGPGGFVRSAWLTTAPAPALAWCQLVVALGGLAAEMEILRSCRSAPASDDFRDAALLCRAIVQAGAVEPPWPALPERAIALERAFAESPPDDEARVLRAGYAKARDLVAERRRALARLVVLLADRRVVGGVELEGPLGSRPIAATELWRTLSGEVRAEFSAGKRRGGPRRPEG